jgi:hypothetical protein
MQIAFLDGEARPDEFQQFAFADNFLSTFEQGDQYVVRARADLRPLFVDPQGAAFESDTEPAEAPFVLGFRPPTVQPKTRKMKMGQSIRIYSTPTRNF